APYRESAWAALISALQARGNVAEALHVFEEVRTRLREELGAVPGRELMALHAQLLTETDEPAAAPAPAVRAPLVVAPRTQPAGAPGAAADLVERDDELRAVDAAVQRVT